MVTSSTVARPGVARRDLSPGARWRAFADAGRGLARLFASGLHPWIHLVATLAVAGLALWLGLPTGDWCWLVLAVGLVWVAEASNSALEELADALHPGAHPGVGRAKDVAAAAVLLAAVAAAAIGLLVLGPPLWERLTS